MLKKLPKRTFKRIAHAFGYELIKQKEAITPKPGYHYVPNIYGKASHKQVDIRENKVFNDLAQVVRDQKRTLLYYDRLFTLFQGVENVVRNSGANEQLTLAEVGVFKGGGSYFIASAAQQLAPGRVRQFAIDTFEGHSEKDIPTEGEADHQPCHFNETSYEDVSRYLSQFDFVTVIKNRIQDCEAVLTDERFHFVHLDMDIYHPTYFALGYFAQRLAPQGIIVIDDYGFTSCPGAREAVDQFVRENPGWFAKFELMTGQCLLVNQRR